MHTTACVQDIASDGAEAVRRAGARPGAIATLALPADVAWSEVPEAHRQAHAPDSPASADGAGNAEPRDWLAIIKALRDEPQSTLLLLGDRALRESCTLLAGKIAAATGCAIRAEFYTARMERGAGAYRACPMPWTCVAALASFRRIILVGARPPVAFAYPDKPGRLSAPGCEFLTLSTPQDCPEQALSGLCDALNAHHLPPAHISELQQTQSLSGPLTPEGIGKVLAATLSAQTIVVEEAMTTGRGFDALTAEAAPHDWLTSCGGSIGFALPAAVGAAIAAPERRVLALEGDGSGMYTLQSLWTMARESLNITTVIL